MAYRSIARTNAGTRTPFIALLDVLRGLLHVGVRFLNRSVPKRTLLVGGLLALSVTLAFAASDLVGGQGGNFGSGGCIVGCSDAASTPKASPKAAPAPPPPADTSAGTRSMITVTAIQAAIGYLFDPFLPKGALLAIEIAALAMVGGALLGLVLALMRLSSVRAVSSAAWSYIWFMRGTPVILQIIFLYDALPVV